MPTLRGAQARADKSTELQFAVCVVCTDEQRANGVPLCSRRCLSAAGVRPRRYTGAVNEVGDMVLGINGEWMVRPPENCGCGHLLAGNCIVAAQPCSCQDRHMSWRCDTCGHITYGPALGPDCDLLNGAARVR